MAWCALNSLYRPATESILAADLCIAAERQTFVSALTVVLARCRLGVVHFAFWVDGWAYMAALTLGQLWSRALAVRPLRHGELHALRAGLRAAIECFQHLPGGLDRSRSLGQLEDGLACVLQSIEAGPAKADGG
jgi:hypothetical protein